MTIEPWDTLYQKLPPAMGSGDVPDIATPDYNVGTLREYIKQGLIPRLTRCLVMGQPGTSRVNTVRRQVSVHRNGQLYAAPANWATLELYWNKTLFAKAGIPAHRKP